MTFNGSLVGRPAISAMHIKHIVVAHFSVSPSDHPAIPGIHAPIVDYTPMHHRQWSRPITHHSFAHIETVCSADTTPSLVPFGNPKNRSHSEEKNALSSNCWQEKNVIVSDFVRSRTIGFYATFAEPSSHRNTHTYARNRIPTPISLRFSVLARLIAVYFSFFFFFLFCH